MTPEVSDLNLTPTSTAEALPESARTGGVPTPQMEHVHPMLSDVPAEGVSRFPLSSTARVLMVALGWPCATQLYVQPVVPVAGCQVVPPSVDTSTPATTPPPVSEAVPDIVIRPPSPTLAFAVGEVTVDEGAVVSVEAVAAVRPLVSW